VPGIEAILISTITDQDITGSDKLSLAPPRVAVNAVLLDADSKIALSYVGRYDLHTLPGGGVENHREARCRCFGADYDMA
ncbi:MAG: hypothetical protein WC102_07480, partial [Saccharofermentanales bacterium]